MNPFAVVSRIVLPTIVAVLIASPSALSGEMRAGWPTPEAAWSRVLGDVPEGAAGKDKTRRGVPLGGIGAGSFMYNIDGTFGPWNMEPGQMADAFPPQAAFHFREQGASRLRVKTLAAGGVLPAWKTLKKGEGLYSALFPKAWTHYEGFDVDLSLKVFSPVIKDNYKETSYPVAVFLFLARNGTPEEKTVGLMLTFPNASLRGEPSEGRARWAPLNGGGALEMENRSGRDRIRWALAASAPEGGWLSHSAGWDARGDGADVLEDFASDGTLSGAMGERPAAGASAVSFVLKPGETRVVPFALAWAAPVVRPSISDAWLRRYTEYFPDPASAAAVAEEALLHWREWEDAVDDWTDPIANDARVPTWLRQAALNELYYDVFGGVFWENGPAAGLKEPGRNAGGHKYFCMECMDYPFMETLDVRHYENRHMTALWPKIERSVLAAWADMILDPKNKTGETPHDAGLVPASSPYRNPGFGTTPIPWKDLPSRYIQQVWSYIYAAGDVELLNEVWPALVKTYNFMKIADSDGDRLPNNEGSDNTYDNFGLRGTSALCGGLWVGALMAMEKMADLVGDVAIRDEAKEWGEAARNNLDKQLWDEAGRYYRIDSGSRYSSAVMADALNGQRHAETSGLGDILPPEKMRDHYWKVFRHNVAPFQDYDGDGVGDVGAINAILPDGSLLNAGQSDEVWTGTTYFLAAQMYDLGERLEDEELKQAALDAAYGVYHQTWVNDKTAYWFNTPEAWSAKNPAKYRALQYQRPRAVWELLMAVREK